MLNACHRFEDSEEWQAVRATLRGRLRPGASALDLGTGDGLASYALARFGFLVTGVEPDPSNLVGYGAPLSMAAFTALPVEHSPAFGEELPFPDGTFVVAYVRQILHHSQGMVRMMSNIARGLMPGGVCIACRKHVGERYYRTQRSAADRTPGRLCTFMAEA